MTGRIAWLGPKTARSSTVSIKTRWRPGSKQSSADYGTTSIEDENLARKPQAHLTTENLASSIIHIIFHNPCQRLFADIAKEHQRFSCNMLWDLPTCDFLIGQHEHETEQVISLIFVLRQSGILTSVWSQIASLFRSLQALAHFTLKAFAINPY